jgi:hypothetical protein
MEAIFKNRQTKIIADDGEYLSMKGTMIIKEKKYHI